VTSNPEARIADAMDSINAKRRKALPGADQSVSCNHCGGECSWDDGYECKPCKLVFDLEDDSVERADDGEPECGEEPTQERAKFWADGGMKLWPCNLTRGHETSEHHHPMTIEEPTP
jgi:hypothetical protein